MQLIGSGFAYSSIQSPDPSISSWEGDYIAGVLADGSLAFFSRTTDDFIAPGTITFANAAIPAIDTTPMHISSGTTLSNSLLPGQSLTISGTAVLGDYFKALSSTLNIEGGTVFGHTRVANSEVNISGGNIGSAFEFFGASTANITGGTIDRGLIAYHNTQIDMSDGLVNGAIVVDNESVLNISGGTVGTISLGSGADVTITGGTANISGGTFSRVSARGNGGTITMSGGSIAFRTTILQNNTLNLLVLEAFLNGDAIDLHLNETNLITQRGGVLLSGKLLDGSQFEFTLNELVGAFTDFFHTDSTLTVTLVPSPGTFGMLAFGGMMMATRRRRS